MIVARVSARVVDLLGEWGKPGGGDRVRGETRPPPEGLGLHPQEIEYPASGVTRSRPTGPPGVESVPKIPSARLLILQGVRPQSAHPDRVGGLRASLGFASALDQARARSEGEGPVASSNGSTVPHGLGSSTVWHKRSRCGQKKRKGMVLLAQRHLKSRQIDRGAISSSGRPPFSCEGVHGTLMCLASSIIVRRRQLELCNLLSVSSPSSWPVGCGKRGAFSKGCGRVRAVGWGRSLPYPGRPAAGG